MASLSARFGALHSLCHEPHACTTLQRRRHAAGRAWLRQPGCLASASQPGQPDIHTTAYSSGSTADAQQQEGAPAPTGLPRRGLLVTAAIAAAAAAGSVAGPAGPAAASKLPEAVDRMWEGMGGGPADLVFPEEFLGVWDVQSVLTSVQLPLGPEFVPDMRVVQRAQREDLNSVVQYQVAFMRNRRGEVVPDRSFNTASLMQSYLGGSREEVQRGISWDPDDPNQLTLELPGGLQVSTRVTRRSQEVQAGDERLSTSEYFQQLIASPRQPQAKVKASQCFTKYHWRSSQAAAAAAAQAAAAAGGGGGGGRGAAPQIVATQVVSDYLTSYDDPAAMMQAGGKPVTIYTYRMAFFRTSTSNNGQQQAQAQGQGQAQQLG